MIRVLALIKENKSLIGLRLYDEKSKTFGDYEIPQAINYLKAYGCSNIGIRSAEDIISTECGLDRIPVLDRMLNKTSGGSYFIISKTRGSRGILYTVLDIQGKTCEISDKVIVNRIKSEDLINAKVVYRGNKACVSAIKGSIKEVSKLEDTDKLEKNKKAETMNIKKSKENTKRNVEEYLKNDWKPIYKFADNCVVLASPYEEEVKLIKPDGEETAKAIKIEWMKHNKVANPTYADIARYKLRHKKLDEKELDTITKGIRTERQLKDILLKHNVFHLDEDKELALKIMIHGRYVEVWDYYEYRGKKYASVRKSDKYFGLVDCETLKEVIPCYFEGQYDPLFADEKGKIELALTLRKEAHDVWPDLNYLGGDSEIKGYFDLNTGEYTNIKVIEIVDTETGEDIEMSYNIECRTYF